VIRFIVRLAILALAALGAKVLYDRLAPHTDQLQSTGSEFVNRVGGAAREVGATVSDASQNVAASAKSGLEDVKAAAVEQTSEVKRAADDASTKAADELAADQSAHPEA
jgi:hypothetical protein